MYELARECEDWDLDEILTCIPALAIVATWFAMRRWRKGSRLNQTLNEEAGELADALAERRAMEAQLLEGYKAAAMGTFGGRFGVEIRRVLEAIRTLAGEETGRTGPDTDERGQWERIAGLADQGLAFVNCVAAFGDEGMRGIETIIAVEGVGESFCLAKDEVDSTHQPEFRMDDETPRIRVNRREFNEVGVQLVANSLPTRWKRWGRLDGWSSASTS